MSDNFEDETPEEEGPSFAELFESYEAGMQDNLQVGDKINGKVIALGADTVFIDTGTKVDGTVERAELLDDEGRLTVAEGDRIDLYVVAMNEHEIRLSRALAGVGGLDLLTDAYKSGIPVEGRVRSTCKGGFDVDMLQRRAFCPISQIDVTFVENPETYVGQTFEFLITQLEQRGKNIVVSRRKLLAKEIEKQKAAFLAELQSGDVREGRVTRLMPYGAFVELTPGLEGMVHISELSWSRVEKPEAVVQPHQTVTVKVLSVEAAEGQKQVKIALSMKQAAGDPWETLEEGFKVGDKVHGTVMRCAPFGVFVELAPGIEGLVHISEMSYVKRVVNPADEVAPGEAVAVLIKEIDPARRRIALSLRDAQGDPWLEAIERFKVGQVVDGTLEKREKFGCFITLAPGITGLLPQSKINASEHRGAIERLKTGDRVTVTLAEIHPRERKITLAPGDAADDGAWQRFAPESAPQGMGTLADKLRQAMGDKKKPSGRR